MRKKRLTKEQSTSHKGIPCDSCGRKGYFAKTISCGVHMKFCGCDNPACWEKHTTNFSGKGCFPVEL